jgi:primosomal protein N''
MNNQTVPSRINKFFTKHGISISLSPTITLCGLLTVSLGSGISLIPRNWNQSDEQKVEELVTSVAKISFAEFKQNLIAEIGQKEEGAVAEIFRKARIEAGEPMQQLIRLLKEEPVITLQQFEKRTEIAKLLHHKFGGRMAEFQSLDAFLKDQDEKIGLLIASGGAGKTRLSIEYARDLEESNSWNVYFVHPTHDFCPFHVVGKTLLILDDASRYKHSDKLTDFVLNPPIGCGAFKLLLIDRPIFEESIESGLSEKGAHAKKIEISNAELLKFLNLNYKTIDRNAAQEIAQKSSNSFVYASLFAEYYLRTPSIPELARVIDETVQKYAKDIELETGKRKRNIIHAIEILSLIEPLDWEKDRQALQRVLPTDGFEALEALFTVCADSSDLTVLSDGKCAIKPDPVSDCIKLGIVTKQRWLTVFNELRAAMPYRIAYNIVALLRLDSNVTDKVGHALKEVWRDLNDREQQSIPSEFFRATELYTTRFSGLWFCDVTEANRKLWITRYVECVKQHRTNDFRESFINSLASVTSISAYYKSEQAGKLKERVQELETSYEQYKCREIQIAFARELVNATRFFVRTNKIEQTQYYLAKLEGMHNYPDQEIAFWLARALVNSIEILGKSRETNKMRQRLDELRNLSTTYGTAQFKPLVVTGIINALSSYALLGLPDEMEHCVNALEEFQPQKDTQTTGNPDFLAVAEPSTFFPNVLTAAGKTDECLQELGSHSEIGQRAAIAFAASIGFGLVGKLDRMEGYIAEFKNLVNKFGDGKCKGNIAIASCLAIEKYSLRNHFQKAEEHFQALEGIYQYPDIEIAIWMARGSSTLVEAYGSSGLFDEMEKHLLRLFLLDSEYSNTEIKRKYASGLLNASLFYGNFFKLRAANNYLNRLKKKYENEQSEEFAYLYAKCLANAVSSFSRIGAYDQVKKHLNDLRPVHERWQNPQISRSLARAIWNSMPYYAIFKTKNYSDLTLLYEGRSALSDGEAGLQRIRYTELVFMLETANRMCNSKNGFNSLVESMMAFAADSNIKPSTITMCFSYLLHLKILYRPHSLRILPEIERAYSLYDANERVIT